MLKVGKTLTERAQRELRERELRENSERAHRESTQREQTERAHREQAKKQESTWSAFSQSHALEGLVVSRGASSKDLIKS